MFTKLRETYRTLVPPPIRRWVKFHVGFISYRKFARVCEGYDEQVKALQVSEEAYQEKYVKAQLEADHLRYQVRSLERRLRQETEADLLLAHLRAAKDILNGEPANPGLARAVQDFERKLKET